MNTGKSELLMSDLRCELTTSLVEVTVGMLVSRGLIHSYPKISIQNQRFQVGEFFRFCWLFGSPSDQGDQGLSWTKHIISYILSHKL